MKKLLLLRPEPGLSASADRARSLGIEVICCPLFRVEPSCWDVPDPADYDGLLLTSANAVRHAGPGLDQLKKLPVHAVGKATAKAAHGAGLQVETIGSGNVADLLKALPSTLCLLHLAGEDFRMPGDAKVDRRIVYRAAAIASPELPPFDGMVVAAHSPRAGARLAELAKNRGGAMVAAISRETADACGTGWAKIEIAGKPDDNSLLALAAMLCQT